MLNGRNLRDIDFMYEKIPPHTIADAALNIN